ncbi:acyl-CoA-binding protein [Mucilaginibacter myungsuensis]|uniref:Acyl-CoA-binding protein n=1 Tax=Mucilaginibacter myungsuensis TaxID=649104 RepID=A0A929KSG0_9SPHI|nr:acyl-CoA-binding protein [Mucilaginibacter myungsuensis]MBE9660671.1 acyl-CoA-binding protein [Mucilaginibacter myungsuensis]MDN3600716.1 acyl-CoA-binding protein [Mucilaginibacter myungsuensis]
MSDLKATFDDAVAQSKQLTKRPDNETLLKLYSLYKQATDGDMPADTEKPGMFDFVAAAKYTAWKGQAGLSSEDAMNQYIEIFKGLKAKE